MKPYALALLALVACGGGGTTPDNVVRVTFGTVANGRDGYCAWDDSGATITLSPRIASEFYADRIDAVLRHELWHAMTRVEVHSDDEACVSCDPAPNLLDAPCAYERAQVEASVHVPLRVSFPEDPLAMERAASWWNAACGDVLEPVP